MKRKLIRKQATWLKLSRLAICCVLVVLYLILSLKAMADESEQDIAIRMIASTLNRLGEKDLANRFLADYQNKRIRIADLSGEGVNAETGKKYYIFGGNVMTLDKSVLSLARVKKLWEKNPYQQAVGVIGWAITVYHEYIHMDQKDPKNTPRYEDPAWQATENAIERWCDGLKNELDALKKEPASNEKGNKLQELKDILLRLSAETTTIEEGIERNIKEGILSANIPWKYKAISAKIGKILSELRLEIDKNKNALLSKPTVSGGGADFKFQDEFKETEEHVIDFKEFGVAWTDRMKHFTVTFTRQGSLFVHAPGAEHQDWVYNPNLPKAFYRYYEVPAGTTCRVEIQYNFKVEPDKGTIALGDPDKTTCDWTILPPIIVFKVALPGQGVKEVKGTSLKLEFKLGSNESCVIECEGRWPLKKVYTERSYNTTKQIDDEIRKSLASILFRGKK